MEGSIRRRGKKSWELTIDLGWDSEGKRKRKFVTVRGLKADAEAKLRELLSLTDKGVLLDTRKTTLAQWLEVWHRDYVTPHTRPKTVERYEEVIRKHLTPHLGHVELVKVAPSHIQALEAKLAAQGMAPAGVDMIHNVLSGAFKYAIRMEVAWRNPVQAVKPPKITRKEIRPPDIADVKAILDLAKTEEHSLHPCLHLIAYTGVRRGEALGLRWHDVDLGKGVISISQSLGRTHRQGLIFSPPKTNSGRRSIDLDASTVSVLRAHRGQQLLDKMQADDAYENSDLVFADALGRPMDPMGVTRGFQALAKRVGVSNIRLHDLRHFHATVMLQGGQSPALVSKRLGHASIVTTVDVYGHLLPGWQKEAADAFAKAMDKG